MFCRELLHNSTVSSIFRNMRPPRPRKVEPIRISDRSDGAKGCRYVSGEFLSGIVLVDREGPAVVVRFELTKGGLPDSTGRF